MKAGLIADIHGNLPALDEVLEDMPAVDQLWCLGDIVGYNPWPRECLERVRDEATAVVQGNHDRRAAQDRTAYKLEEDARIVLEWTRSQLSDSDRKFLENLPSEKRVFDDRVLLSHSDPRRVDGYVYPDEFQELKSFLGPSELIDVLAMGHSHVPHADHVGDVLVVNPGSVGQPRDGNPRASYAVLHVDDQNVDFHRVDYDIASVVKELESNGLPKRLGQRLWIGE